MLNPYQKKNLKIKINDFEKITEKPSIIKVYEHLYPENTIKYSSNASTALCPIHGERTPSFAMYEETNTAYCFSCSWTGDSYKLIMEVDNMDFRDAVEFAKTNNLYD